MRLRQPNLSVFVVFYYFVDILSIGFPNFLKHYWAIQFYRLIKVVQTGLGSL